MPGTTASPSPAPPHLEPEHDYTFAMLALLDFHEWKVWCVTKAQLMGELREKKVVTFQGTTGMIRLEGGPFNAGVNDMAEIELHKGGNRTLFERFPALNQYQLQVEAFGRSVREGAPFAWTLENAKGTQAMIDWAYREAVDVTI